MISLDALADQDMPRARLLVKQARFSRVLHLWHVEGLSTLAIAHVLDMPEADVCDLIEEGDKGCSSRGWQ